MAVHLFALCWNEEAMLPYFFRHYDPIVDRFHIFDDGSTDGSLDVLRRHPRVVVESFEREGDSYVLAAMRFYREAWKASRGAADWVIVCNVDEHLYHPDLPRYLDDCQAHGVTAVRAEGYEMVADRFPGKGDRLCDTVRSGARWDRLDKVAVFDPSAVEEIGYSPGRHRAEPVGRVVFPEAPAVKLLHFKHVGLDYFVARQYELRGRLLPGDVANGYGAQYLDDEATMTARFDELRRSAVPVL